MKALILSVIFAMSLLKTASATSPIPQEIAEQLNKPGHVISHRELLSDSDLKFIIYAQHGNLFIITYARWADHMWNWKHDDILEIFIPIDKKPHILYSRQSPP